MDVIYQIRTPIIPEPIIEHVATILEQCCNRVDEADVPRNATWFLSTNKAVEVR